MKLVKLLVMAVVAVSVFAASSVFGAEAKAEKKASKDAAAETTIAGTVTVVMDAKGAVTGEELLTADSVKYNVALNAEGKTLEQENGKKVEVVGTVSEAKNGKKWLHVKSYKEVTEAPAK